MISFFLLLNLFVILIIYKFRNFISKKLKLDLPVFKNSIHTKKSYLLGGIILFSSFLLSYFNSEINYKEINYLNFFLICSFFVVAIIDDIIKITPVHRLLICLILLLFTINYDFSLSIKTLNSYYFNLFYFPENNLIKFLFPALCIIIFINAFNFIDGIDGLACLVGISFLIYIFTKNLVLINVLYLFFFTLTILVLLNFKKSIFLGDSGNYLISIIVGSILIKENYYNPNLYYSEEIFLLLFVPGIDMLRLFAKRIFNNKNPFLGDTDHLHHKLYFNFGKSKTILIYLLLVNIPIYIFYFNNNLLGIVLALSFIFYCFLIFFLSKNNNKGKK